MNDKTKNVFYYIILFITLMILILLVYEVNKYNKYQDNQTKLMQEQIKIQKNMYPKHAKFTACYKKVFINHIKRIILDRYAKYQKKEYQHYDSIIISENNIKNNTKVTVNSSYLKKYERNSGIIECDVSYTITPTGSMAKEFNLSGYTVYRSYIKIFKGYNNGSVGALTNTDFSPVKEIAKKEAKDVFNSKINQTVRSLEGKN